MDRGTRGLSTWSSQKADLTRKIAEEAGRITRAASNDVDMAKAKVASLLQGIALLERAVAGRSQSLTTLKQLEERAASARSLYEASLTRFQQVDDREAVQRPDARILSSAAVPRTPNFPPRKELMFGIAIPASLFLGFLAALLKELLGGGFRTSSQVEQTLALPVLAATPEMRRRRKSSVIDIVNEHPLSSYAEAMRGIQFGLTLPDIARQPKVILLTSAMPKEGKSSVALSLARLVARSGKKVVLMDCDFRRPSVRKMVGVSGIKKGLVSALLGRESVQDCFHKDQSSDVLILVPETIVENPAALLGSAEMENLVLELRGLADWIIIDSAPLLPVNDTKLLVPLVDTALMLVRWEKTPRNAAIAAARILYDLHAPVAGVVITRAESKQYYAYNYGFKNYGSYARYCSD